VKKYVQEAVIKYERNNATSTYNATANNPILSSHFL